MMDNNFSDRRQHFRIPMVSAVEMTINDDQYVTVLMVDLSAGGLKLLSQTPLSAADEISISIPLLENRSVKVKGKVAWVREIEIVKEFNFGVEFMAGIQFDKPNEHVRKFIKTHYKI